MNLRDPILAKCGNREETAEENPFFGGPENLFNSHLLQQMNLKSVSFDFFINWKTNQLDRNLWLKRLTVNDIDVNNLSDVEIIDSLRSDKFLNLVYFAKANNFSTSAIIFNDNQNWGNQNSNLIIAHWPLDANLKGLKITRVKLDSIQEVIREKSGGPIKIGSKGLYYGTSNLECYLSSSDALWPGDADLVLLDKTYKVLAILEFKKHTKSSTLCFEDQTLANYYPKPDGRKYHRLKLLSSQINTKCIPFFVVYYSVLKEKTQIIVEQVEGDVGKLYASEKVTFDIELSGGVASCSELINYIIKK